VLEGQLAEAYANSPRSNIVNSIDAPVGALLNYHVKAEWWSVESAYENWISTRKPPLFGTEPDARVWMLANEAPDPTRYRVLDIGGGTGRNTLALARRGHPVDVVEMTSQFAAVIRAEAVFELATQCLAGGGRLVFNAFLAKPDYTPDSAARALGQQCYTTIFTPQELVSAASGLPLQLVSDDAVYDYEMAHLPE
jgi:SAM-dependent methyltransferase